jgi:hypothetical protein
MARQRGRHTNKDGISSPQVSNVRSRNEAPFFDGMKEWFAWQMFDITPTSSQCCNLFGVNIKAYYVKPLCKQRLS